MRADTTGWVAPRCRFGTVESLGSAACRRVGGAVSSSPLPVSPRLGILSSNWPHARQGGRWAPVRQRLNPQHYFCFALALAFALG
jgi:hypothetical protein